MNTCTSRRYVIVLWALLSVCRSRQVHVINNDVPLTRIVTYNAGLTPSVPKYEERRNRIADVIAREDADVLCLQEVWFGSDMRNILSKLGGDKYPYSYSDLHVGVGNIQGESRQPPCSDRGAAQSLYLCIIQKCSSATDHPSMVQCAKEKCNLVQNLDQQCVTCLMLTGVATAHEKCMSNPDMFNLPGLLLISKLPLEDVQVRRFVTRKVLLPRAYISAKIPGVGSVACAHLTASLGNRYFEVLPQYSSWADQNMDEMRTLIRNQDDSQHAVILGDLNSGPRLSETDVAPVSEEAYNQLIRHGYEDAFVTSLGICTYCRYNPLVHGNTSVIFDHVLTRGINVAGTRRILDENVTGLNFPASDHFGIEISAWKNNL